LALRLWWTAAVSRTESRLPSQEQRDAFLQLLRAGNYVVTACTYTGISERAVYDWLAEAKRPDCRPAVAQLAQSIKEARAFAQAAALQVVMRAAHSGTWQAAAWFLERSNPSQWGRHQRHEVEVVPALPVDSRAALAAALAALGDELRSDEFIDVEATPPTTTPPEPVPLRALPARAETA
jgi:hypothetical protein